MVNRWSPFFDRNSCVVYKHAFNSSGHACSYKTVSVHRIYFSRHSVFCLKQFTLNRLTSICALVRALLDSVSVLLFCELLSVLSSTKSIAQIGHWPGVGCFICGCIEQVHKEFCFASTCVRWQGAGRAGAWCSKPLAIYPATANATGTSTKASFFHIYLHQF